MSYLKNTWYVAAYADEVEGETLLGRTILGQPVLMFRTSDGVATAIGGRCPHRFAPLHMGRHMGDVVQCGYHGLEFDAEGRCSRNPHGPGERPPRASVPKYPLVERHGLLWIWMGEAAPDESKIPPQFAFLGDCDRATAKGVMSIQANYTLLVDNLMDLSHGMYLHRGSLSTTEMAQNYRPVVTQEGDSVTSARESPNISPPSLWVPALPEDMKRVDFFSIISWFPPSLTLLQVGCRRLGKERDVDGGISAMGGHLFTPETETSTHYFWSFSRTYAKESAEIDAHVRRVVHNAFYNEDKPMIEAQQVMMGQPDLMSLDPILLPSDAAAMRVRRLLDAMIAAEQGVGEPVDA